MRPWTTRTLNAVVVAAGFAAVGTGTASAAEATNPTTPDLTQVPDEIGFTAPVNTCATPAGVPGREKTPCVDSQLRASAPNLFKEVGKQISTTAHGVGNEVRDGQPVAASGEATRLIGHVANGAAKAQRMTKERPSVGLEAQPDNTGVLRENRDDAKLLDAGVGPRKPNHEGVSAADTAVDATVAEGYDVKPLTNPVGAVTKAAGRSPVGVTQRSAHSTAPVALPEVEQVVPATEQVPALRRVNDDPAQTVRATAADLLTQTLDHTRVGKETELSRGSTLPVGDVVRHAPVLN